MGQNKAQKQAAERAKKPAAEVKAAAPTPAPATPAPAVAAATPATPSKQQQTIEKLTAALREKRQIEVKPEQLQTDGKFINVMLGEGWPTIRIGNSGGITVMELKSYTNAFDAAVEGDVRLRKQTEREQKKAVVAAPVAAPAQAKEAVTQKKGRQHEAVEQQSQSA